MAILCKVFCSICVMVYLHVPPLWLSSKNPPHDAGNMGSTSELGRSLEEEVATRSSILDWEIPEVWPATVHGVAKES